jgi:signal transduction histidine kinase
MATIAAPVADGETAGGSAPSLAVVWGLALAGVAAAAIALTLALTNEELGMSHGEPLVVALLFDWITVSYVACGLIAWSRRPASRFGPLMIAAGFVNFAANLSWSANDVLFTFGESLDLVVAVLFLHVCLAYPSGRLRGRFERGLVVSAYAVTVGLQLVHMAVGDFGPHNLLAISSDPDLALVVYRVQLLAISAFCLCGLGILVLRRIRAGRPLRRSLALLIDSFALGLVLIALFLTSAAFEGPWLRELRWALLATLGLAPIAFLAGLLHSRLARAALGDLLVELRREPAPEDLRDALARALRDPSLSLAYWLPELEKWADVDGHAVELPADDDRRATTLIERDGVPVAALVHDPALRDEPELLEGVRAAAAISLEHARLQAELLARLEELKGSRARIIEAGDTARRRIERDLHDGAQQRLVALAMALRLAEFRIHDDPEAAEKMVASAREEVKESLSELRELARGIHPAVLDQGLGVALESLATRSPIPVSLTLGIDDRLPSAVEIAAYFVASEALANIGKYAQASRVAISVRRQDGLAVITVADDGVGGADAAAGSGLRGLVDRVEALGGRLHVDSPAGGGTVLAAEIPCVLVDGDAVPAHATRRAPT